MERAGTNANEKRNIALCIAATAVLIVSAVYLIMTSGRAKTYNVNFEAIQQTVDDDNTQHMLLRGLSLRRGEYAISIGYIADSDVSVEISLENDTYVNDVLPATYDGSGLRNYDFTVRSGTDRGRIDFTYPEGVDLQLAYITISSDRPLYNDALIWGIVLLLLIPCVWMGAYCYSQSKYKKAFLITLGMIVVQIIPFLLQQKLHMGIDTRAHMMRIEGVYYGLLDGQFPAVIAPEWNNSYGQTGALYPNLFLYIPAVLRLLGMSQIGTFKLFVFLVITATAIITYACARHVFGKEWQICLVIIMCNLNDMHLYNMLGDGRFGGALLAEMFYPLVIAGLIDLYFANKEKWYYLAFGVAGILCSHVMSATIICFTVVLFSACCIKHLADKTVRTSITKAVVLFAGLILGTAVSFLKFYFSDWGQEKLQWENYVETLFPRGYLPDDIRWTYVFALLIICIVCIIILYRKQRFRRDVKETYIFPALVCAVVLLWVSTVAFPWRILTRIHSIEYYTNMIQDAYRFLSLSGGLLAFCVPALLENAGFVGGVQVKNGGLKKQGPFIAAFCAIGILCTVNYILPYYEYFVKKSTILYYDEDIGEVEYQMDDYLPKGTLSEWYVSDSGVISDEDAVTSIDYERDLSHIFYSYTNTGNGSYVEFPKFYYDGYVAVDEIGNRVEVTKGDRNRTRVYLKVTDIPAVIKMWYHLPWYMTASYALSMILWICSPVFFIVSGRKRSRHL